MCLFYNKIEASKNRRQGDFLAPRHGRHWNYYTETIRVYLHTRLNFTALILIPRFN